ncbi:MAG: HAD-IIIA family hydrolase [Leptospiraceae bacterium]|nr:HAD-IIIA family hydrolase [Leptospiraceae bacterium]MDW8306304.1 HAD-IIIA family hydrolase [Leptospiraceae bacterium]
MGKRRDIKVLFCDVDGTLTDGSLYYSANGEIIKVFHVHDGQGIRDWLQNNRIVVVLSSRQSDSLKSRFAELGISELYQNVQDKATLVKEWLQSHGFEKHQAAYIGDDVNDLKAMKLVALSACPVDAHPQVREAVDYVCDLPAGRGAVREFIDYLLKRG